MSGWHHMDSAPRDGRIIVLRADPYGAVCAQWTAPLGAWTTIPGGWRCLQPTGWCPIPHIENGAQLNATFH